MFQRLRNFISATNVQNSLFKASFFLVTFTFLSILQSKRYAFQGRYSFVMLIAWDKTQMQAYQVRSCLSFLRKQTLL